jgi:hypothetical protein
LSSEDTARIFFGKSLTWSWWPWLQHNKVHFSKFEFDLFLLGLENLENFSCYQLVCSTPSFQCTEACWWGAVALVFDFEEHRNKSDLDRSVHFQMLSPPRLPGGL